MYSSKVGLVQKNVTFGQVVRKSQCNEVVQEFGHAVEHRTKRCRDETDNRTSLGELLFPFWQNVGIGKIPSFSKSPGILATKATLKFGNGVHDNGSGIVR